jgi:glycosyltransferase involved in cell wall biosynthesis
MRPSPEISVVIPTYNRPERARRLLLALADQTLVPERFEVIAVDNYSADNTSEVLASLVDQLPYTLRPLRMSYNRGPAPARNLGWQSASAPIIAFTDDDCVPKPEWLAAGLAAMQADPELGVLQGKTTEPEDLDADTLPRWNHRQNILGPSAHFEACNIFYRRSALAQSGGYDEEIGWWGEDAAAGWKVVEAGWKRGFLADAVVIHDVTPRGVWWHIKNGALEGNMVRLAGRHPGFRRDAFWRPWAYRREDAAFVAALAGGLVALRWRPGVLLAIPYLWWQRPSLRNPEFVKIGLEVVAVDAARSAGQLAAAMRHKVLVI